MARGNKGGQRFKGQTLFRVIKKLKVIQVLQSLPHKQRGSSEGSEPPLTGQWPPPSFTLHLLLPPYKMFSVPLVFLVVTSVTSVFAQVRCPDGTPNTIPPFLFQEGKQTLVNRSSNGLKFVAQPSAQYEAPLSVLHVSASWAGSQD